MTNCFSVIALVIIRENKTKIANILKIFYFSFTRNTRLNMLCARVIAIRENEVLNQSARAISIITSAILLIMLSLMPKRSEKSPDIFVC